jgi:nucleoside-diphosphate-sugar epimerase
MTTSTQNKAPNAPPKRVALTGASGFLGRYLLRTLVQRGWHVVAAVRNPSKLEAQYDDAAVTIRRADLGDPESLARAFAGCDAVISNAALIALGSKSRRQLIDANQGGTRHVFWAMKQAGVQRAVLTSSVAGYRQQAYGHRYRESDALWQASDRVGHFRAYGLSKALAEQEAWRLAERYGIALSCARPSNIYGAGDPVGLSLWLKRLMRLPRLSILPRRFCIAPVYAGDVAESMANMLERPSSCGRAYNLCGEDETSLWQLYEGFRDAGGKVPRRVFALPVTVHYRYCSAAAARDLGFCNRSTKQAFEETLALEAATKQAQG